jgi:hypothetical protein
MRKPPRTHPRRPHAKLDAAQMRAAWQLYQAGYSLRELANAGWQTWGYASAATCASALQQAFDSDGRRLRSNSEAMRMRFAKGQGQARGGPSSGFGGSGRFVAAA